MHWSDDQFAAVFHEVHHGLCRYLEGMLGRSGAAQEIAQESFLRLYRVGPGRVARGEERFWLYRVATNLARNEIRRTRLRETLASALPTFLRGWSAPDPLDSVERDEADRELLDALASLGDTRRAAILLRERDGLRYDEIARVLDVSISKVKVDIFRARAELRARLGDDRPTNKKNRGII